MIHPRNLATITLALGCLLGNTTAAPTPETSSPDTSPVSPLQVWYTVDCASNGWSLAAQCDTYCRGATLTFNTTRCSPDSRRTVRAFCGCVAECTPCDRKLKEAKEINEVKDVDEAELLAEAKKALVEA